MTRKKCPPLSPQKQRLLEVFCKAQRLKKSLDKLRTDESVGMIVKSEQACIALLASLHNLKRS